MVSFACSGEYTRRGENNEFAKHKGVGKENRRQC